MLCCTYLTHNLIWLLRGGTPPWGVIFHENVNFLFVAKTCKVTHTFHKLISNMWLLPSKPIFWWTISTRQCSVIYVFSCDQAALQMVFSVCPSVCLSVCLSVTPFWLCSHHHIIMKFSGVITNDQSKVHAKGQGQRSRSQRSQPNLTVSGL